MGRRIFISYRRSADSHFAGRLFDALSAHYGSTNIFMDVDSIDLGHDFMAAMHDAVVACDVLIVVIGRGWARVKDGQGGYRLHDPNDPVAFEISTALERGKTIVPILVEKAPMPTASILPEPLRSLVRFNGQHVRHASFRTDTQSLISAIDRLELSSGKDASKQAVEALAPTPQDGEIRGVGSSVDEEREHYRTQIRNALTSRSARTRESRYEVYEEARRALGEFLRLQTPPLPGEEVARRVLLLEDCILEEEGRFEDFRVDDASVDRVSLDDMFAAELRSDLSKRL